MSITPALLSNHKDILLACLAVGFCCGGGTEAQASGEDARRNVELIVPSRTKLQATQPKFI